MALTFFWDVGRSTRQSHWIVSVGGGSLTKLERSLRFRHSDAATTHGVEDAERATSRMRVNWNLHPRVPQITDT
jgi:hypothetical protein